MEVWLVQSCRMFSLQDVLGYKDVHEIGADSDASEDDDVEEEDESKDLADENDDDEDDEGDEASKD